MLTLSHYFLDFKLLYLLTAPRKITSDPSKVGKTYKGNECSDWTIRTLEGQHRVSKGDFVICGIKGEFYPCKPDIFEQTYEEVK